MNKTLEMDKVIKCLALELPEPVWNDVNKKWQEFKATLQQSHAVSGEADELAKEFANDIIGSLDWLDINGQTDWSNVYESFKSGYAAAQQSGNGWVSVSSLKKLITNMKDKNFLESVIIEEVERNLDNPERLHKVFPPSNP